MLNRKSGVPSVISKKNQKKRSKRNKLYNNPLCLQTWSEEASVWHSELHKEDLGGCEQVLRGVKSIKYILVDPNADDQRIWMGLQLWKQKDGANSFYLFYFILFFYN